MLKFDLFGGIFKFSKLNFFVIFGFPSKNFFFELQTYLCFPQKFLDLYHKYSKNSGLFFFFGGGGSEKAPFLSHSNKICKKNGFNGFPPSNMSVTYIKKLAVRFFNIDKQTHEKSSFFFCFFKKYRFHFARAMQYVPMLNFFLRMKKNERTKQ